MDNYIGEIRISGGDYAPDGWSLCDGRLLSIQDYPALFALIGTIWGGDGRITFGVPDLRGRLPVGEGTGTGLTARTLGASGGAETVTLGVAAAPAHTHSFAVTTTPATDTVPSTVRQFASTHSDTLFYIRSGATGTTALAMNDGALSSVGGGALHANLMPSLAVNYIIALTGLYPQSA